MAGASAHAMMKGRCDSHCHLRRKSATWRFPGGPTDADSESGVVTIWRLAYYDGA
jgi:hypothetical protein